MSQSVTMDLDPVMGRMTTPINARFLSVFAPVQAMDLLKNPTNAYAGVTDVVREKLLTGAPLFGIQNESEVSKRCGVIPRRIGNVLKVSEMVNLAHNCAVNHLRRKAFWKASTILAANGVPTPAILEQSVLDRFNAVLDPDDRINGAVNLNIPSMQLPLSGIGRYNTQVSATPQVASITNTADATHIGSANGSLAVAFAGDVAQVFANFSGALS